MADQRDQSKVRVQPSALGEALGEAIGGGSMGGYGEGGSNNPSHSNHKSGLRQDFLAVLWRNLDRRICSDTIFGAKRTPPWVKPQAAWLVSFRIFVRILLLFISRVTAL